MNINRNFPIVEVSRKAQAAIENGHPWVYDAEVRRVEPAEFENGSLVDVISDKGRYLGTGIFSGLSKIRVRILSRNANDKFDEAFWRRRVNYAWDYRRAVMGKDASACRVIFGEADHFPGLTVDLFSDIVVTQTLSIGMERLKSTIFPIVAETLEASGIKLRGIFERNDPAIRTLEGLETGKGWFAGVPHDGEPITEICENGIYYNVDVENGQKTGFFLDQKYNRREIARLAEGKTVLDCFTHTGSFALNAAMGGAAHVTAVDVSQSAIELARSNAERNKLQDRMDFMCADVFDLLPELEQKGDKPYNFIILDPPAFTKSRKTVDSASRGYNEINFRAMKLLPRGGYLATCSCSHFMENSLFVKMLKHAADDAKVELRQIEARQQAPDHPILWGVPETDYLKFYIFQIV
ncbi:MAG: class I SAM-dependent rRNA methyltransferase [Clostridiales bacterium]|nr:class I SAM-dependent rRNA methyltransferase [Clostridiales bacterium]